MHCSCKIQKGRTDGSVAPKLCKVHKRIVLEMIDKCLWWARCEAANPLRNDSYQQCGMDMAIRLTAGRSRVERGEPFDVYTEIND